MPQVPTVQERTMKMREVFMRAINREISWIQAAEILGCTARSLRRWKMKYRARGVSGLVDQRTAGHPSPNKVEAQQIEPLLRLYRERYRGVNVRHFCAIARRQHGLKWSYSFVRQVLQNAGLVRKQRPRGRHFLRRPPRPCFGEMLHLDGSHHPWLALRPEQRQCLIAVVDDATRQLLYAQLAERETTQAVLAALHAVFSRHGLPQALYTDRAGWAVRTAKAGEAPDERHLTQVGRALQRLGVEHIVAYSPQARGRGERVNRTLQDRLVQELRLAGVRSLERANHFLSDQFLPGYNQEFARAPADPAAAFVTAGGAALEQILCHEETRQVGKDNTVMLEGVCLQLRKQPGRATCAGLMVQARRHLDGTHTVWRGLACLGRFDARGRARPLEAATRPGAPGSPAESYGQIVVSKAVT